MRRLGERKANIAIARSLLETVYVMLRDGLPYREPDPNAMHEVEKAKLVRHHARRLRQLGADVALLTQLIEQIPQPVAGPSGSPAGSAPPTVERRACPAKVCRGALRLRARQTRKQVYSVVTDPSAGAPRRGRPRKNKDKTTPAPN